MADLEALVDAFAPGESVDLVGHSLGGNVVMLYAGVRPARVRRVVSLEGFGIPKEDADRAPTKIAAWLDALAAPPEFAPYRESRRRGRPAAEEQPAPAARQGAVPRGALGGDDGRRSRAARLRPAAQAAVPHDLPSRGSIRGMAQHRAAPTLWVAAADSTIPKWLNDHPEGEAGADGLDGVRRRMAQLHDARLVVVPDASHMLHHDQPAAVAAAIEAFLAPSVSA